MNDISTKAFLGKGWKFPVTTDEKTREIALSEYEQDIREAIWIILSTAKGERIMRPDFGCGIHDLVYDSINASMLGLVKSNVFDALLKWEARIDVLNISISIDEAYNGKLIVSIDYRVRQTNNEFNLVYPFYLSEGT